MQQKPEILETRLVARSRLFGVESMQLRFANGVERTYERLRTPPIPAVMVVPMLDADTVVMIREYCAGVEDYLITLPKGALDAGEDWREAGNRELQEEVGYAAGHLEKLKTFSLSPGYMGHHIHAVLAWDLTPSSLPGDEPEPLEVLTWKLSELEALLERDDCTEARVIAALYMARERLAEVRPWG